MTTLPIQLPQWQAKRRRRLLVLSASQMETHDLCARKWWNDKVRGLADDESSHGQIVGTVAHSVIERYLGADRLGRDPQTGYPVELYPAGWHLAKSRYNPKEIDGEAYPEDQDKIKRLVQSGIEQGIFARSDSMLLEHEFRMDLMCLPCGYCGGFGNKPDGTDDCEACGGDGKGDRVQVMGYIDVLEPDRVQDHKTTSQMRYAKSPEALRTNIQMMIYAKVCKDKYPNNPRRAVDLRHNVLCLDPKDLRVRRTETTVSFEEIEKFWESVILKSALAMAHERRAADHWTQLPNPDPKKRACSAYGGCSYQWICTGKETVETYESRKGLKSSAPCSSSEYEDDTPPLSSGDTPVTQFAAPSGQFNPGFQGQPQQQPPAGGFHPNNSPGGGAAFPTMFAGNTNTQPQPGVGQVPFNNTFVTPQQAAPASHQQQAAPAPLASAAGGSPVWALPATLLANLPRGQQPPPWAIRPSASHPNGCGACQGFGFDSNGNPCPICDAEQAKSGGPRSSMFTQSVPGNGTLTWSLKPEFEAQTQNMGGSNGVGQAPTTSAGQQIRVEERTAAVAPTAVYQQPPAPVGAPGPSIVTASPVGPAVGQAVAPPQDQTSVPVAETGKGKGKKTNDAKGPIGRPPKGFVLCIFEGEGGVTFGEEDKDSGRGVYQLATVLETVKKNVAAAAGVQNFYDIKSFDRWDLIRRNGEIIAKGFGTDFVVASGLGAGQSDLRALVEAIRPFAGFVIVG